MGNLPYLHRQEWSCTSTSLVPTVLVAFSWTPLFAARRLSVLAALAAKCSRFRSLGRNPELPLNRPHHGKKIFRGMSRIFKKCLSPRFETKARDRDQAA